MEKRYFVWAPVPQPFAPRTLGATITPLSAQAESSMSLDFSEAQQCIEANGVTQSSSTKKVIEYLSQSNEGVIYLRVEPGFPNYAYVVVHPNLNVAALVGIEGVEVNPRNALRYSSNMKRFPKRINGGKDPISYGQALHVHSRTALEAFSKAFHRI